MSRRKEQLGLLAAFHKAGVEYVIVGGVAVNAHGFVRNTKDLDIFFRPDEETAKRAFRALESLGAPLEGLDWSDLLVDYEHHQLNTPNGRIDLLTSIGNIPFEQVWRGRLEVVIEGVPVRFISKEDLIANKLEVGRNIDQIDAEELALLPEQQFYDLPSETDEDT